MNLSINSKYPFNKEGKNYFSKQMTFKIKIEIRISLRLAKAFQNPHCLPGRAWYPCLSLCKCVSLQPTQARALE